MPSPPSASEPRHVLFVDDEPAVLEGLRQRLQPMSDRWQMTFVDSGQLALSAMGRQPQDVIVSDLGMPGMDGAQLLGHICERWPGTIRIALTADQDTEQRVRLLPLAHQCLRKPCRPEQLADAVARSLSLREELASPAVRDCVGRIRRLPSRPQVFGRLQAAMARPQASGGAVAAVIAGDTVLTAKVLQMANSAFFRRARRISSIEQAIMYLGFQTVRNLALCAEVFARWPGQRRHATVDPEMLHHHALRTAAVAASLTAGLPCADDTVLAALLHDIGYLVLVQECPRELEQAMELARAATIPLYEAEREILGASHAALGAYLLGLWGLPHTVVEAVAHHHQPEGRARGFDALAALAVAIALTGEDDTTGGACTLRPSLPVDARFLAAVGAPLSWEEARERAGRCLAELAATAN